MIVMWLVIAVAAVVVFLWTVRRETRITRTETCKGLVDYTQLVINNIKGMKLDELRTFCIRVQTLYLQQLHAQVEYGTGYNGTEYLQQLQDQQDQLIPTAERQRDQLATALMILADKPNLQDALRELQSAREKKRRFELTEEIQLNKVWNELMKLPESDSTGPGTRQPREGGSK